MIWKDENTDYFAAKSFSGMVKSRPDLWCSIPSSKNSAILYRREVRGDRIAIIVSGGAGNGPLFPGFVGDGLADAAVVGAPFAAPNAYTIYEAGKLLGQKRGVLLLYNNFAGDYLNNDMAAEMLQMDGIQVESVIVNDDIATAIGESREQRSGRCGISLLIKLAGSMAARGHSLKDVASALRKANNRLGTISMSVDFSVNEINYGHGFSGEPGIVTDFSLSRSAACETCIRLLELDLEPSEADHLFLLVNRLRLTSYADSYIMADLAYDLLVDKCASLTMRVGTYSNIDDVYGFTFSLLCMDESLRDLMADPISSDNFMI